jgi:SAM-dependent methyltransferase
MEAAFERQAKLKQQLEHAHADLRASGFKKIVEEAEFRLQKRKKKRKSILKRLSLYFSELIQPPRISRRIDRSLLSWDDFVTRWSQVIDAKEKAITGEIAVKAEETLAIVDARLERVHTLIAEIEELELRLGDKLNQFQERLQLETVRRQRAIMDLKSGSEAIEIAPPASPDEARPLMETFYFLLEERYRGSKKDIQKTTEYYLPDLKKAKERVGEDKPVLDIGCGRGEFVDLMRQNNFDAVGIDFNNTQLDLARAKGLPVIHGDARIHLNKQEENSLLAITGIHIVEHIPFPDLLRLCEAAYRALAPGGIVIFETPNPKNLIVGAHTFHFDPTHIKPLPMEVMELVLETVGFSKISKRPLHPSPTLKEMVENQRVDLHIAELLFGAQDYAIIGQKT